MINNIQGLRAFAAVIVIFGHLEQVLEKLHIGSFGWSAVQLFFVISGFVMVCTTRSHRVSPVEFARKRIVRIVPIYWVMTLVVFGVAIVAPKLLTATEPNAVHLLKSLLFIPFEKQPGVVQPVLFLGWSLNYEMFFYALFTISLAFRRQIVGLGFVMATLLALVGVGYFVAPTGVLAAFYTSPMMLSFVLGMAVALLLQRAPQAAGTPWKVAGVACLLAATPILFVGDYVLPQVANFVSVGLASSVMVASAVLIERWGWGLKNRLVLATGAASYVLYLSHAYIARPFQKLIVHFDLSAALIIPALCICLAVIVAVALLLHRVLERPLIDLAGRWIPAPSTVKVESAIQR